VAYDAVSMGNHIITHERDVKSQKKILQLQFVTHAPTSTVVVRSNYQPTSTVRARHTSYGYIAWTSGDHNVGHGNLP